jgi:hypothetical protein
MRVVPSLLACTLGEHRRSPALICPFVSKLAIPSYKEQPRSVQCAREGAPIQIVFPSWLVVPLWKSTHVAPTAPLDGPSKLASDPLRDKADWPLTARFDEHRHIYPPSKLARFLPYGGGWSTERLAMGPGPCRYGRRRRWRDALFEVSFGRSRERNKFAEPSSDMSPGPHPSLEQTRPSISVSSL